MSIGRAPSAVPLVAISRDCCATVQDSTPKSPTAAIASAKTAKPAEHDRVEPGPRQLPSSRCSIVATASSATDGSSCRTASRSRGTNAAASPVVRTTIVGSLAGRLT